tara:strand:- start:7549 stop:8616 length:1068 start_codon:yes stop_codon:yes gene_type:complete
MPTESVSLSLLSIISLVSFFIFLVTNKFSNKIKNGILLDSDFKKPQAFHKELVPRSGGLAGIISLIIFFILYYLLFEKFLLDYLVLSIAIFLLGFLEDIKFKISPNYRLIFMIVILTFFIFFFSIGIKGVDVPFLNAWMDNAIFSTAFILLCFLFIMNGANLVDGFNGLLTIHLLIINIILVFLNLNGGNQNLAWIITGQIVVLLSFLVFNFPKAKMFMGDSGSYLFGSLVAFNIIKTNNSNPEVSSFFFCVILFYLFYEVFFSFFRKIFQKKSPLKPDEIHLHMLVFRKLKKINMKNPNALTGLIINLMYLSLILPALFSLTYGQDSALFYRYWFFGLLGIYTLFYTRLYKLGK